MDCGGYTLFQIVWAAILAGVFGSTVGSVLGYWRAARKWRARMVEPFNWVDPREWGKTERGET